MASNRESSTQPAGMTAKGPSRFVLSVLMVAQRTARAASVCLGGGGGCCWWKTPRKMLAKWSTVPRSARIQGVGHKPASTQLTGLMFSDSRTYLHLSQSRTIV